MKNKLLHWIFTILILFCTAEAYPGMQVIWKTYYSSRQGMHDVIYDMVVDKNGFIYVTGTVTNFGCVTMKYSPSGIRQWVSIYNNYPGSDKGGRSINVDDSGNVYVTGNYFESSYFLIKYNSEGVQQWVTNAGNFYDPILQGYVVTSDKYGNVYTATIVWGSNGYYWGTIKYNNAGVVQWSKLYYCGSGIPYKILVDSSGNVYVGGSRSGYGIGILKYNPNGVQQWLITPQIDNVLLAFGDMHVDEGGNVFITGRYPVPYPTYDNAMVIKYNTDSVRQWYYINSSSISTVGKSITSDSLGNIYIAGNSHVSTRYFTLKLNSNGVFMWSNTFTDGGPGSRWVNSIGVDRDLNVYVTGEKNLNNDHIAQTIKYNSVGIQQWVSVYNNNCTSSNISSKLGIYNDKINIAGTANILNGNIDNMLVQYNNAGAQLWSDTFWASDFNEDYINAINVDDSSNVYVTGTSETRYRSKFDYFTIKYSSSSANIASTYSYRGTANDTDIATCNAVDPSGNVILSGYSKETGTGFDLTTVKFNPTGTIQWTQKFNGQSNGNDGANALVLDRFNNVYVTGKTYNSITGYDIITIKYNSSGSQSWLATYNGGDFDETKAIKLDNDNNVYITGKSRGISTGFDYITIKYDSTGTEKWVRKYNGAANDSDEVYSMTIDSNSNVIVTGKSLISPGNYDYVTIKYDSNGNTLWIRNYNGNANGNDVATSIKSDSIGNIYVTGYSMGLGTNYDYATIKYGTEGNVKWTAFYNGPASAEDKAYGIEISKNGHIYVTGSSKGIGTNYDISLVDYDSLGIQSSLIRYNSYSNDLDESNCIVLDKSGNICIGGYSKIYVNTCGEKDDANFYTIKVSPTQFTSIKNDNKIASNYFLNQNYPNPFNPSTKIKFGTKKDGFVNLKIFDLTGREIETLVSEYRNAGIYEVTFHAEKLSSGIYFYNLVTNGFTETKKMLLIK